ncbi:MAG TPA: hypothetical protein VGM39_13825 [Kofleriaceae bacterium]
MRRSRLTTAHSVASAHIAMPAANGGYGSSESYADDHTCVPRKPSMNVAANHGPGLIHVM